MNISGLFRTLFGQDNSTPKIAYSSDGRSGHVHYQSKEADFALYYEFGGGDCVASIYLPKLKEWQKQTGLPPDRREDVLNFIGRQVAKDQTTNGKGWFKIEGDFINIYA
jgi:hypothetical protein